MVSMLFIILMVWRDRLTHKPLAQRVHNAWGQRHSRAGKKSRKSLISHPPSPLSAAPS
jgi:hypothetical protein